MARGRRFVGTLVVLVASIALALGLVELAVRAARLDERRLLRALYYQGADVQVHRVAADRFLHYEMRPGAARSFQRYGRSYTYSVSIDRFGARGREHPEQKGPGVFRILTFGGSSLYGAEVDDDQTIAAVLERRLDERAARLGVSRFEVWDFGTSAYTLGQAAHLARRELKRRAPDLILLLHHNNGRRAFLLDEGRSWSDYAPYFAGDGGDTWLENFPPDALPEWAHLALLNGSAAYRWLTAGLRIRALEGKGGHSWYGDMVSEREKDALLAEARAQGVPVAFFTIPASGGGARLNGVPPERQIALHRRDREPAFYEVHPPAPILAELAAMLADELEQRKLLPSQ